MQEWDGQSIELGGLAHALNHVNVQRIAKQFMAESIHLVNLGSHPSLIVESELSNANVIFAIICSCLLTKYGSICPSGGL